VLHKCDDESGCCENDAYHCVAKHQQPVNLFFYVVLVNGSSVEMLTFTNDTECECREVNFQPRTQQLGPEANTQLMTITSAPSSTTTTTTSTTTTTPVPTFPDDYFSLDEKPSAGFQMNKGKEMLCDHIDCPNPFAAQLVTKERPPKCKCDCMENDVSCARIKRGLKRLSRKYFTYYRDL